jgi:hypothetical protein
VKKWITKPLALVAKFQIITKVLVVYYYSCWVPSMKVYQKMDKALSCGPTTKVPTRLARTCVALYGIGEA